LRPTGLRPARKRVGTGGLGTPPRAMQVAQLQVVEKSVGQAPPPPSEGVEGRKRLESRPPGAHTSILGQPNCAPSPTAARFFFEQLEKHGLARIGSSSSAGGVRPKANWHEKSS